jgi:heat shock protein HslJ
MTAAQRSIILICSVWLLSCSSGEQLQKPDTMWRIVSARAFMVPRLTDRPPIGFSFGMDSSNVSGYSGCNQFFGSFRYRNDSLQFGPLVLTKMFCQSGSDIEQAVIQALRDVVTVRIDSDVLVAKGASSDTVLVARRERTESR